MSYLKNRYRKYKFYILKKKNHLKSTSRSYVSLVGIINAGFWFLKLFYLNYHIIFT